MRLLAMAALFCGLVLTAPALRAQESEAAAHGAGETPGQEEHGKLLVWMWANFAVLAVGLGYLVRKHAGPFYAGRSRKIRKDLIEAGDLRKEAEERAAEVERRLANLEAEVAALRAESQREAEAETERLAAQTTAELAKIQAHAEQEIDAAGRAARLELKRYSAGLAVELAARKIRGRMSPEAQDALVGSFVQKLEEPSPVAQSI
jgi:F-type H+-transporting ATPase subunit b